MKAKVMKKTAEAVTKTSQVETTPIAEKTASVKTVETKSEVKEAAEKVVAEKASAKKTAAKAAAEKTAAAGAVKKSPAKKAASAKRTARKAEIKSSITLQFYGKSYTEEELLKIAKDVWKFDLKKKAGELESVELYVKPEENTCYYVMNKDIGGSFSL